MAGIEISGERSETSGGRFRAPEVSEILDNARALAPRLRERIAETEQLRRLPEATLREAAEGGIISLLVPRSLGGAGGGVRDFVELVRTLAHGHLSAAWTLAFLVEHNWMLARYPTEVQNEVFRHGGYALMSGVISPPGKAVATEDGYVVTGNWGYATGIMHSDWVQVFATVEGRGDEILCLLRRADVEVQDTWHMSGMGGTGSNHVKADGVFVPQHRTLDMELWAGRQNPGASLHPEAVYSYALRDILGFLYPSMSVGAAEAMLEGYRDRVDRRRAPFNGGITADTTTGQVRYARSTAALRAAQASLEQALEETVLANEAGTEALAPEVRAGLRLSLMNVLRMAWESIEIGLRGSGTSVFKSDSATQHFVRDMEILLSHQTIDEDTMFSIAGQILLGRSAEVSNSVI